MLIAATIIVRRRERNRRCGVERSREETKGNELFVETSSAGRGSGSGRCPAARVPVYPRVRSSCAHRYERLSMGSLRDCVLLQLMVYVESRGLETRVQASWVDRGHGRTWAELSGTLMNRSLPAAMVNTCAHDPGPGRTIDPRYITTRLPHELLA